RVCPAALSPPDLCHRRTSGGQGVTKKTHHGSNPPRKFGKTRRSHRIDGGCQRLASCICPSVGALATSSWLRRSGVELLPIMASHGDTPDDSGHLDQDR